MRKLRAVLFSIPSIAILTMVMATISMFCSIKDKTGDTQHLISRFWSRVLLRLGFVRCLAFGVEKLRPEPELRPGGEPRQLYGYAGDRQFPAPAVPVLRQERAYFPSRSWAGI